MKRKKAKDSLAKSSEQEFIPKYSSSSVMKTALIFIAFVIVLGVVMKQMGLLKRAPVSAEAEKLIQQGERNYPTELQRNYR